MSCADLAIKLERLNEDLGRVGLAAFERELTEFLSANSNLPSGPRDGLITDLSYAVARHRQWHKVAVFPDLLQDLATAKYGLPAAIAAPLAAHTQTICERVLPASSHTIFSDSHTFLRRIFVATASALNERELYLNLGLGPGLIKRMRASVAGMAYGPQGATKEPMVQFIPELDAQFSTILLELSRCLKTTAWALDYFRLFDALLEIGGPWPERLVKADLVGLLQTDFTENSAGASALKEQADHPVLMVYNHLLQIAQDNKLKLDPQLPWADDLVDALVAARLALPTEGFDSHRKKPSPWQLQPLGQSIVAEGFYRGFVQGKPLSPGKLLNWPETIQQFAIAHAPLRELDILKELVVNPQKFKRCLTPSGMNAAIKFLAHNLNPEEFEGIVKTGGREQRSAWSRKAMCEALLNHQPKTAFHRQFWLEMAQFDTSPMVREAALTCLIKSGFEHDTMDLSTLAIDAGVFGRSRCHTP